MIYKKINRNIDNLNRQFDDPFKDKDRPTHFNMFAVGKPIDIAIEMDRYIQ